MNPDWAGWIKLARHHLVLMISREEPPGDDGVSFGPRVGIYFPPRDNGLRYGFGIEVSDFTELELNAFEEFIHNVIELARPITQLRDQRTREGYAQGSDDYARLYRSPPEVVTRPWARGLDSESLLIRLAYDAPGIRANRNPDGAVSTASDGLAEQDENDAESSDDRATT